MLDIRNHPAMLGVVTSEYRASFHIGVKRMSSTLATTAATETRGQETLTRPAIVQSFLELLTDPNCRAVMAATTTRSLTTRELSEEVGLPLSTAYRKVADLTEAGVLVEGTRLSHDGSHASEYHCVVDDVVVSVVADAEAQLRVPRQ